MGTFLQDMGIRIAVRRKELGMTQEDLARRVQLTPQTISSAECGKKGLKPENIAKLSTALCCTTDYLMLGRKTNVFPLSSNNHLSTLTERQQFYLRQALEAVTNSFLEGTKET